MYGFKKQLLKKTTFLAIAIFALAGVPSKLIAISCSSGPRRLTEGDGGLRND